MSQFIVSARKYRPLKFDDVVGQQHVTQTLKNAIRQDTLAHAFLFCGPRGVGKTTCARILAKVLNCQNVSEETEPCGTCDSCRSFDKNASLNILELDAASNNSVEHIRSLNEQVRFQPQEGDYKVFIIDEVHMLSQQAFNAFLKTLEEPPPYAIFILATTEKHKIIPTILSRCQIFDFRRIQVSDMVSQLQEICASEGIQAEQEALHMIASKSDGALRDALSIFDKVASFASNEITYADVISNLNILDYEYFFKITDAMLAGEVGQILSIFDQIQRKGFDGDIFLLGLADHFRNLLVCKHQSIHHLLDLGEQLKAQYQTQSALTRENFLLGALDICNTADVDYKMAKNKRLHVELALIKMNYLGYRKVASTPEEIAKKKPDQLSAGEETASREDPKADEHTNEGSAFVLSDDTPPPDNEPLETPARTDEMVPAGETMPAEAKSDIDDPAASPKSPAPAFRLQNPAPSAAIGSLGQLVKAAEERFAGHHELASQVVSLDQVEAIWKDYAANQPSKTVRAVLERATLDVKQNNIVALVASPISKTVILQETGLMERLRAELGLPKLTIKIEIDHAALENIPTKKILTTKEKFEHLCDINPQFKAFRQKFGLKLDSDA